MPFDDSTTLGYSIALFIQIIASYSICTIIFTVCSVVFGLCWYIVAFLDDLSLMFSKINAVYVRSNRNLSKNCGNISKFDLMAANLLSDIIRFHMQIMTYVKYFKFLWTKMRFNGFFFTFCSFRSFIAQTNELMNGTIFFTFGISVLWICTSLFQIHSVIPIYQGRRDNKRKY